jgi:hypothetical protein
MSSPIPVTALTDNAEQMATLVTRGFVSLHTAAPKSWPLGALIFENQITGQLLS